MSDTSFARLVALQAIFNETAALFLRMRAVLEELHGQGELTGGRRAILLELDQHGPRTIAHMARVRPVTRQYMRTVVHQLEEEGLVEFADNLAHKRSHLVRLTDKGKMLAQTMLGKETQLLMEHMIDLPAEQLQTAAMVLQAIREWLEQEHQQYLREHEGHTGVLDEEAHDEDGSIRL